jgi:hypothetical protein
MGVKINLFSSNENIDLIWRAMILFLYFFILDLKKLGLEAPGIVNGADSTQLMVLELSLVSMLEESGGYFCPHPLNSLAPMFLCFSLLLMNQISMLFFLLLKNSLKFFYQALVVHYSLLQCVKIGRIKKKQLFVINIMPIQHYYFLHNLMCCCTC